MQHKPTRKQWQTTLDVLNVLLAECKKEKLRSFTPQLKKTIELVECIRPK